VQLAMKSVRNGLAAFLAVLALSACASLPEKQAAAPGPISLQILALNDFHGNLEPPGEVAYSDGGEAKRAPLGGVARIGATLSGLREGHANTITVAAGDMISASPLVSAHFLDEPAIEALNTIGLDITSVGNHEFDRGIAELRRMQDGGCGKNTSREPCALEPFPGAQFTYLAGNTVDDEGNTVFPGTAIRQIGPVRIGFIGMTLKDTASLVSPAATRGWHFLDEAPTANALAARLREQGADAVVLLIHQGGWVDPTFNTDDCPGLTGDILPVLDGLDPSILLVISGHTHNAYVCKLASTDGSQRLLTSAGRYGYFVTDIELQLDPGGKRIVGMDARNVPVLPENGERADTEAIVRRYVAAAKPVAERVIGHLAMRGEDDDCIELWTEDLVADSQLAATADPEYGGAQISFINSGGVRAQLVPGEGGAVTYGQIFPMLPFGSSLEVLDMSGAQIKQVLEQQFCGEDTVKVCFSTLAPSAGFTYSYDLSRSRGERIVSMRLGGEPIVAERRYRVTVNNFLANGGDGFAAFNEGMVVAEAGLDLDALEEYIARGIDAPACGRVRTAAAQ